MVALTTGLSAAAAVGQAQPSAVTSTNANRRRRRTLGRWPADLRRSAERNGAYLTLTVLSPESLGDWPACLFTRRSTHRKPVLSVKRAVNFVLPRPTLTVVFSPN